MNVPLLIMLLPAVVAVPLFLLGRLRWLQSLLAGATTVLLAVLSLQIPLEQLAIFAGRELLFRGTWSVLGRAFTFAPDDRPALAFVFVAATVFFLLAGAAHVSRRFVPVGLALLSLLAAMLFVEPFLFASLFIVLSAALATLILADERYSGGRGAMRLLVFTVIGVPFILLAGWLLEAFANSPDDLQLVGQARLLVGIGFVILLSVVPFHSWVPIVAEESPSFEAAYVLAILPAGTFFFLLNFLNQFSWMREPEFYAILRLSGLALTLVGGVFAFGQRSLGRLLGYTVLIDMGAALLALSLGQADSVRVALVMLALRAGALVVWGLGQAQIRNVTNSDRFDDLAGLGRQMPFATAAVLFGGASLLGLPVTAGFVGRWALYQLLADVDLQSAMLLLLASLSGLLAYARAIAVLLTPNPDLPEAGDALFSEGYFAIAYALVGVALILVMGAFPQLLLPAISAAADAFAALTGA